MNNPITDFELKKLLEHITGRVTLSINETETEYESGKIAARTLNKRFKIDRLWAENSKIVLKLKEDEALPNDLKAEWVKEHEKKCGEEPGFF